MITDLKKHPWHYASLFALFCIYALIFSIFQHINRIDDYMIIITGVTFFIWSLVHHYLIKDLSKEIIIEYFLFSLLAVIMLRALIQY